MTLDILVSHFLSNLSPQAKVLTSADDSEFKELLLRWSNINHQTPGAIVVAGIEGDVATIVRLANDLGVPFVAKSGGHSLWSTIGEHGFILDLSLLKRIDINVSLSTVTIQSGVVIKEANKALFKAGLCLPLGTANTAGVIPMALGGGLSVLTAKLGYASDSIISARLVTAEGEIVVVSDDSNPDLFYGVRGAGQFFGIVTELTMQAHPLSILGTSDCTVWTGSIVFPIERSKDVIQAMYPLLTNPDIPTCGLCMISAPPPKSDTCIIILPFFFGSAFEAERHYAPILALKPLVADLKSITWDHVNDSVDAYCGKGDFKRFAGAGAQKFKPEIWPVFVEIFEELKEKCPDAGASAYALEWNVYSPPIKPAAPDTAFSHRDINVWMELLSWYTDEASHTEVHRIEQKALAYYRNLNAEVLPAIYQNWSRDVPLEYRYRGKERLERLKRLKQEWDPKGIFTTEFI